MKAEEIRERLFSLQDEGYREFQAKLMPTVPFEKVIGVRTPALREFAKELYKAGEADEFLTSLPHEYFEENQLHAFIVSLEKDYSRCMALVSAFLPYVDNWATCDQMSPKVFKKHKEELLRCVREWLSSGECYIARFGIKMLMEHFLDADFEIAYLEAVAAVPDEEYYVHMMVAWYFATALAKQWDATLPFIEGRRLRPATHNKAIHKAVESYRITPEQKAYLKTLKGVVL
ncbi:MAG: DNA alkylation repair protein [Clostridia bacterium]|nr:DNA alkylation repair protein [Clostridia bacterium]